MKIDYLKYNPTGNITILVTTQVERELYAPLSEKLMELNPDCEQVGFIENTSSLHLQMMGGEFCGNASLCFSKYLYDNIQTVNELDISVSGILETIHVSLNINEEKFTGTINMPLPIKITKHSFDRYKDVPIVYFNGIGHAIVTEKLPIALARMLIRQWAKELKLDAFGIMILTNENTNLDPIVYVKATDSVIHENSCASGTSAVASWLAYSKEKSVTIELQEPGGCLTASAEYADGINCLEFTGNVELISSDTVEINLEELINEK